MGGSTAPTEAVQPGTPVSLTIPSGATGISVTRPDGTVVELVPGTGLATTVTFAGTELPGIYTVTPQRRAGLIGRAVCRQPERRSDREQHARRPARPARALRLRQQPPVDPNAPVRFAVDLFDIDESTIAPGAAATIEQLGTGPAPSTAPGDGRGDAAAVGP